MIAFGVTTLLPCEYILSIGLFNSSSDLREHLSLVPCRRFLQHIILCCHAATDSMLQTDAKFQQGSCRVCRVFVHCVVLVAWIDKMLRVQISRNLSPCSRGNEDVKMVI